MSDDPIDVGPARPKKAITCNRCGATGFKWFNDKGLWRLKDARGFHRCPKGPFINTAVIPNPRSLINTNEYRG